MIPLRDNISHRSTPIVTVSLIIVNILVFLYQLSLGSGLEKFIHSYAFVPVSLSLPLGLFPKVLPLFTSMFLHGGLMHLLGNMLYLWIFADNVEDRLGHFRFLVFYFVCGISASLIHALFNLSSKIPVVGASGAIAGVLGAYFLLFPRARVLTIIPIFIFWQVIEIPAFFFLGFWFLYQFFLGVVSIGRVGAGIAFWAHIGGFAAGIVFLKLFLKKRVYYYKRR
ncbi:MAG: rhomboid family intramembrane serine protease [Candidatus Omnitrophica bacterium]|nr:rhomboid family intramembrane serine protease [Candidatus Omnitrophota bacterium]